MTYIDFKNSIHADLKKHSRGRTWKELRSDLALPYDRPCPEWTKRLEHEIGLTREKGEGREFVWCVPQRLPSKIK